MAGTFTVTREDIGAEQIHREVIDWIADASGDADVTLDKISGQLIKAVTDPGTPAPTANYDIALTDEEGIDLLAMMTNDLGNLSATVTAETYFVLSDPLAVGGIAGGPIVSNRITVTISNAGNLGAGQLILYYSHHH